MTLLGYLDPGSGGGIGPLEAVIIAIPIIAIVALVVWLVRRLRSRACPRCGRRVRAGQLECSACGFDFRTIGAPAGPT